MSPTRRVRLSRIGMWACIAGAVIFAAVFVGSKWYGLEGGGTVHGTHLYAGVMYGVVSVSVSQGWPYFVLQPGWKAVAWQMPFPNYDWWSWCWPWKPMTSRGGWLRQLAFPAWLPAAGLGIAGAVLWRVHGRAVRAIPGVCGKCGYSRRGLDNAAACPECGAGAR